MKKIEIFDRPHNCPVKKEPNLFAKGTANTEIGVRAKSELWLFCPWCGEQLGRIVEVKYEGCTHLYGTDSDRSKRIPASDEIHVVNCGRALMVQTVKANVGSEARDGICPECLLQAPLVARRYEYVLTGQIVEL